MRPWDWEGIALNAALGLCIVGAIVSAIVGIAGTIHEGIGG